MDGVTNNRTITDQTAFFNGASLKISINMLNEPENNLFQVNFESYEKHIYVLFSNWRCFGTYDSKENYFKLTKLLFNLTQKYEQLNSIGGGVYIARVDTDSVYEAEFELKDASNMLINEYKDVFLPIIDFIMQHINEFKIDLNFKLLKYPNDDINIQQSKKQQERRLIRWIQLNIPIRISQFNTSVLNDFINTNKYFIGIPNVFDAGSLEFQINRTDTQEIDEFGLQTAASFTVSTQ